MTLTNLTDEEKSEIQQYVNSIKSRIDTGKNDEAYLIDVLNNIFRKILEAKNRTTIFHGVISQLEIDPSVMAYVNKALVQKDMFSQETFLDTSINTNDFAVAKQLLNMNNSIELINSSSPRLLLQLISKNEDLFWVFLAKGANLNYRGHMGFTPIFLMLISKKTEFFNAFITKYEKQIDFSILSWDKSSLLHYAIRASVDTATIDKLLQICNEKGLTTDQKDIYGYTPLDWALFRGNIEIACKLSSKSRDILEKDPKYKNPPPVMRHNLLVTKIMDFIEQRNIQWQDDPTIQFNIQKIEEGVCNGWSMLVALNASQTESQEELNFELDKFYKMMDLFANWDGKWES